MKIKINNDVVDLKILSDESNEVSFLLEDEIFLITIDDLLKEKIIAFQNHQNTQINAYNDVFEVQQIFEHRHKELKMHPQMTSQLTKTENQDMHKVAAIMKAYQARHN
ncbi:MAG: hypothetical protein A2381_19965 [Bdellovibrionales bacterium RIFOXYB1_FULL_37_110]|nr:MAG: hypothetical protein A2181_03600 [Bdellovibrionales bacterium RIFOXYA1_FULL_38_20]OFZ51014.1 MAG: hypothetical protein A2417_19750 [Bdellovibrionales bacterium RIFOXYC1_FULL_37_79]OFZ60226.1 MAG: hypothetical protein A2381_19965 [Bdellovibrionales bacterium RIFOXYB1_FULL_37_110]OFZ61588.1 MAG: hypothetical protein A2577_10405 [Bdellovibrionales bacterium RIFOXYD1_FULL_36_51]